ncbi:MAG: DUF697 domain-containing protein [Saprospiraceae bacterium]|nr:DUF697 domain-containing protein [Saprospiraceae bacterium]
MSSTQADSIIKTQVMISMGAGLVPIPILDIAAVTAVQLDMVKQLAQAYGVPSQSGIDKGLITALTGSIFARIGASFIKVVPIVGSLLGGVSMAIMSGASTYAVGQVFKRHFESGGNFANFNPSSARAIFEEEYEKGKQQAEQWKKEKDQTKNSKDGDALAKLKQLGELRDSGVISEEEFQRMKASLMDQI